jgi:hypothetical protein
MLLWHREVRDGDRSLETIRQRRIEGRPGQWKCSTGTKSATDKVAKVGRAL